MKQLTGKCDYCNKESPRTKIIFCQPGIDVELCERCRQLGPIGSLLGENWREKIHSKFKS